MTDLRLLRRGALALAGALLLLTTPACNKHNVPTGGECTRNEDCGEFAFVCLKTPGQEKGYCTGTCSVPPPNIAPPPGNCRGGLVCRVFDPPHPLLGSAYCVKP